MSIGTDHGYRLPIRPITLFSLAHVKRPSPCTARDSLLSFRGSTVRDVASISGSIEDSSQTRSPSPIPAILPRKDRRGDPEGECPHFPVTSSFSLTPSACRRMALPSIAALGETFAFVAEGQASRRPSGRGDRLPTHHSLLVTWWSGADAPHSVPCPSDATQFSRLLWWAEEMHSHRRLLA